MKARAYEKSVVLSPVICTDFPLHVNADSLRIQQVLLNLLSNAIKFTPAGGVVTLRAFVAGGKYDGYCCFSVSDTGIGLNEEFKKRLFERFNQADTSITRKYGGTGLGLSISRQLVDLMHGVMEVESEVGKGSVFSFYLPLERAHMSPEQIANEEKEKKSNVRVLRKQEAKILLVDDAEENRVLIQAYLKKFPQYQLEFAENGQIGLEKFKTGNFDIVLMDMQMPVMDGSTATREIRKWEKENNRIPAKVIALTANAFKEEEMRSMDAGCDLHVTKPISKATLLDVIAKLLVKAA